MPTNRNIVDMVEAIRGNGSGQMRVEGVDGICLATVLSVTPLTIQMHNQQISKNLYINPALLFSASDSGEEIKKPFEQETEPYEQYVFLKKFHEKYVLKKGDTVIVCVTGASFYVAGKAVKV